MDGFVLLTPALLIGLAVIILVLAWAVPLRLWVEAVFAGVKVSLGDLIGMRLRKVNPAQVVRPLIAATKAGLDLTTKQLEAHYLAGGHVDRVVKALISADKANIGLPFKQATAIDLAGRDVLEAVRIIERRSEALIHFVDAYRSFTRLPTPSFEMFSAGELLGRVRRLLNTELDAKCVTCDIDVEPRDLILTADPELIEQVNVNLGTTDVDSPTASAVGGTINYRTMIPSQTMNFRGLMSIGEYDFRRFLGVWNIGALGPWGTRAFVSASSAKNENPFNNYGKVDKQQYNARIWQPVGSEGDFVAVSGHYNQNRNNFFGSVDLIDPDAVPLADHRGIDPEVDRQAAPA